MTPGGAPRRTWKELLGVYMPWMKLDGDISVLQRGRGMAAPAPHLLQSPFYYIDYCLAQTVALEIWAMLQKDRKEAWERYMAYTRQGGSEVFTTLLKNAGLESPFDENCLRTVCQNGEELAGSLRSHRHQIIPALNEKPVVRVI